MTREQAVAAVGATARPHKRGLRTVDLMAVTVGVVLGAGIFKAPGVVAANAAAPAHMMGAWLLGGLLSFVGALCYAELASAYPGPGGDCHYVGRALGRRMGFLYSWARLTVIPTGSIALLGFVFGDYVSYFLPLGAHSSALYAGGMVVLLTALQMAGLHQGKSAQNLLTALEIAGVGALIVVGLAWPVDGTALRAAPAALGDGGGGAVSQWGQMLIFVLLTYGGWNEIAYVSADLQQPRRSLARPLMWSLGLVTLLYLLVNLAYLRHLGLGAMAASETVAADLMQRTLGAKGALALAALIALSALTSANATILTGARTTYAFGQQSRMFSALGRWNAAAESPRHALLAQGLLTLALVVLGALTRRGFETMVAYTAPVFWLFFLLTGVSLIVLRAKEPGTPRPFRTPFFPLLPLVFCGSSAFLLYASLAHTGPGALFGVGVLALGGLVLAFDKRSELTQTAGRRPVEAA